jgi:hypothetical protein
MGKKAIAIAPHQNIILEILWSSAIQSTILAKMERL